jgi:hypothetical protein
MYNTVQHYTIYKAPKGASKQGGIIKRKTPSGVVKYMGY